MAKVQLQLSVIILGCLITYQSYAVDRGGVRYDSRNGESRVWTNKSGTLRTEAELLNYDGNTAYFRGKDGKHLQCELGRLSKGDLEYLSRLEGQGLGASESWFVAHQAPSVTVSGTVSSSKGHQINGVIVLATNERTHKTIDKDKTKKKGDRDGVYELEIPPGLEDTVVIDFIPATGYDPESDRLLKGDRVQEINKVLRSGSSAKYSLRETAAGAVQKLGASRATPVQKHDQASSQTKEEEDGIAPVAPEVSINVALKDTLDKLFLFEAIHARLKLVSERDDIDELLQERVTEHLRDIMPPQMHAAKGYSYSAPLYQSVRAQYDAVAKLYGVYTPPVVRYRPAPRRHHRRIFPLFRRRR